MNTVQVDYNELKEKVNAGWKRPQLAEYFGLKDSQMARCLKDCGLKIRKFHKPAYQVVNMPSQDKISSEQDIFKSEENTEENVIEEVIVDETPSWDA